MSMYVPIAIIVVSSVIYHISSKSTPVNVNPFASLTLTYLVGAVISAILYFAFRRGGNVLTELKSMNWSTYLLGLSVIGLEAGSIYMYKAGWNVGTGFMVHSSIVAIILIFVGALLYHEQITLPKIAGVVLCLVGLFFINTKSL